jgi:membrane-associated protease RseP (regulator of RpoE activity)
MPEEKGFGSKLVGLFIQSEAPDKADNQEADTSETAEKSPAELVAEIAKGTQPSPQSSGVKGRGASAAPAPSSAVAIPKPAGPVAPAAVDFDAVFRQAGMDGSELEKVRKAEELLKSLPAATPDDVKRQIVEASLKAFGVEVAKISAAATNQLKAIDTYVRLNEQATAKAIAEAQGQIQSLDDKIIALKVEIEKKATTLAQTRAAAQIRKGEVQTVLGFFAPAVGPKS